MLLWQSFSPKWWPGKRNWLWPIQRALYGSTAVVTGGNCLAVWILHELASCSCLPGSCSRWLVESRWGSCLAGRLLWEVASFLTDWQMGGGHASWLSWLSQGRHFWLIVGQVGNGRYTIILLYSMRRSNRPAASTLHGKSTFPTSFLLYFSFHMWKKNRAGVMPVVVQALYQITVIKRKLSLNTKLWFTSQLTF